MRFLIVLILVFYRSFLVAQDIKVENEYYADQSIKTHLSYQKGNEKSYLKNFYQNGKLKSEGWLINDKKGLFWIYYFENGETKSEGRYAQENKQGYWKDYYKGGIIKAEGRYKKGAKTDWWIFYDKMGQKTNEGHYIGEIKNGFHHIYEEGKPKFAGHYVNDVKKGTWVTLNKQGDFIAVEEYGE